MEKEIETDSKFGREGYGGEWRRRKRKRWGRNSIRDRTRIREKGRRRGRKLGKERDEKRAKDEQGRE